MLNPALVKSSSYNKISNLFFTDSGSVFKQLDVLARTVRDPVNIEIAKNLDEKIKLELNWILTSNIADSIKLNRSSTHIASLNIIDSLITKGITRTSILLVQREQLLQDAIDKVRLWMLLFMGLAALVLLYTVWLLFLQNSKTKSKEKELEICQPASNQCATPG